VAGGEDDLGNGPKAIELVADGEAVLAREVDIEEDDVWAKRADGVDRADAVGRLADHPESVTLEHLPDDEPKWFVIVNDQDGPHSCIVALQRTATSVPTLKFAPEARAYPSTEIAYIEG